MQANNTLYQMFSIPRGLNRELQINIQQESFRDFISFNEIILFNKETGDRNRYAGNTIQTGLKKFFDKIASAQEFESLLCVSKTSEMAKLIKSDSPLFNKEYDI
jgi:hypothetical protein